MLGLRAMAHAIPAYFFAYAGIRSIFNHEIALYATLFMVMVILLASIISPKFYKAE